MQQVLQMELNGKGKFKYYLSKEVAPYGNIQPDLRFKKMFLIDG